MCLGQEDPWPCSRAQVSDLANANRYPGYMAGLASASGRLRATEAVGRRPQAESRSQPPLQDLQYFTKRRPTCSCARKARSGPMPDTGSPSPRHGCPIPADDASARGLGDLGGAAR